MRYSEIFPKTLKEAPSSAVSVNHRYLVQGGFIDQLMAGSWTILPLGLRVLEKINNIIRGEINTIGGQELTMPLLHPKEIWNETGRWDSAAQVMYQLTDSRGREHALSFTHEEIVMDLLRKKVSSYKDLPVYLYQFSTKFRNEPRATSGILRGREFLMKDLYSAHQSEEDLMRYYEIVKEAYLKIFKKLSLPVKVTEASGGVFTERATHEFQVINPAGEDTIYGCDTCNFCQNKEIFKGAVGAPCSSCGAGKILEYNGAIEVGNIFPLGTMYSKKMNAFFTGQDGQKKPIWFGSYGIGPTRVMGTLVEVYHDDKGIIWPPDVAPFKVHLIGLDLYDEKTKEEAERVYQVLLKSGVEVLFDDREEATPGEKFSDADLIGVPYRALISKKSTARGGVEVKKRNEDLVKIISADKLISY